MKVIEQYIDCMKRGDNVALANLFNDYGVLHDSSPVKLGKPTLHLEGKMAIEMMFHHRFGFNGGPFKIYSVSYKSDALVWYFISYGQQILPVSAMITEWDTEGKIKRLSIYPL